MVSSGRGCTLASYSRATFLVIFPVYCSPKRACLSESYTKKRRGVAPAKKR